MKRLLPLLLLLASPLHADMAVVRENTLLKGDRSAVSIKAGTAVEVVARDGDYATIKYRNVTGRIPAAKLEEAKEAAAPKPETKPEEKPAESKPAAPPADKSSGARPPTTNYGKAVQKAKDNAAAHEKNLVKPADEPGK